MNFDVIIIGASTSGLHAAQKLASSGRKVAVFDRQKELRPARRTLIVTPAMRKLLGGLPADILLHRTGTMILSSPEYAASVELQDPDWIVERAALIQRLLSRAQEAGAEIFLGCRFRSFEEAEGGTRHAPTVGVHFQNSRRHKVAWARDAVIGADGINSDVAEAAEIPTPISVPIVQAEVALPPNWDPNVTQVWFEPEATRFFYWLIPESAERGVVGLVGDEGVQTQKRLRAFLNRHGLEAEAYQGARVALHHPRLKTWGKIGNIPLLMVGDAAGQVKITTVGGLVTGIEAAEAAARSIINGTTYKAELRVLKRELDLHWLIRLLLDRLDIRGYDLLVSAVSSRLQGFLSRHNRDSMAPVIWQLPFVEPKLLKVAFQCLRGKGAMGWVRSAPAEPTLTQVTKPGS
ncbi:MAG: NAD(P)/FAD-dependent oxidoreductase [Acidobacteriota bacterium]|nr:NAD(P)/FAD-dependent oxidoreductase [Acidobacteriota bacterium]